MRFRTKFGAVGWCTVSIAGFWAMLFLGGLRTQIAEFIGLTIVLLALQRVFNQLFIYWELDSESLRERRLWSTKAIPWQDVTHVGPWHQDQPASGYLEVDYVRTRPISDRGSIVANPEDREQFIAALRRFAPQATFEV